ncbi:hypothetical protein TSUD_366450 [Trifolium subterraneum]|uniref:Uncharacterized protein n=1 Tax=Trifolium subterraneum TaxID=3900 RepID=A0A2Z6LKY1_TRISU|nr:hypothetical protein TSUD_366450 [Trifolium subterraneum]
MSGKFLSATVADFILDHHWHIPFDLEVMFPNLRHIIDRVSIPMEHKPDVLVWIHTDSGIAEFMIALLEDLLMLLVFSIQIDEMTRKFIWISWNSLSCMVGTLIVTQSKKNNGVLLTPDCASLDVVLRHKAWMTILIIYSDIDCGAFGVSVGNSGTNWGPPIPAQGGGAASGYATGNNVYEGGDSSFDLGISELKKKSGGLRVRLARQANTAMLRKLAWVKKIHMLLNRISSALLDQ